MYKKRILLVTPSLPYPLSEGAKVAQFGFLEQMIKDFEVTIFFSIANENEQSIYETFRGSFPQINFVCFTAKVEVSQNKVNIIFNKLHKIKQLILGHKYGRQSLFENPNLVNPIPQKSAAFLEAFQRVVQSMSFDLIQIDLIQFMDLRVSLPQNAKVIFVHHELRYVTLSELKKLYSTQEGFTNYVIERVKHLEKCFLETYDKIFVFSEDDKIKLSSFIEHKKIAVSPFPVLKEDYYLGKRSFGNIKRMIFIGGENHYPNKDGVVWFINQVFSLLKEKQIELIVIGDWSKESMEIYSKDGIRFTGFVSNLDIYIQDSIFICPIQVGSGIRTKLLQAMAKKVPIVTTTIGCEGLMVENNVHCLISDIPSEFKDSIIKLLDSPSFCEMLVNNSFKYVTENFSQESCYEKRKELYLSVIQ